MNVYVATNPRPARIRIKISTCLDCFWPFFFDKSVTIDPQFKKKVVYWDFTVLIIMLFLV